MPKKSEYPLPREKYKARALHEIRGQPNHQMRRKESVFRHRAPVIGKRRSNEWNQVERNRAKARRHEMKMKIEKEIDAQAAKLRELDVAVAKREEILDLATKAPTVKEMRGAVAALFKEEDLDPIKEMIRMVKAKGKNSLPPHQKAMLLKELAQYQAPKPKSVDIQADMDMNVSVGMVDFRNTSKAVVDVAATELTDEDYDEFEPQEDI